jgi:5'-3' exonuclease
MKSLLLIDLSAIFWTNYHATGNESASAAFELTVGKVHQLSSPEQLCAICCDCPPYTRRKALLPSYKANREAAPPAAIGQLRRVKERLEADGFLLWEFAGFEADDVIATAVACARREEQPLEVTIATGDKDLAQLVDDTAGVWWLSTIDGTRRGNKEVAEKFGVPPQLVRDYLALTGDKSDNVPGIPGVGHVNAGKLLQRFGTLEGVLEGAEQITQPALKKNITEHAEAARLAYKLVGVDTDVPLDFDAVFAERTPKPLAPPPTAAELDGVEPDPLLDELIPSPAPARPASHGVSHDYDAALAAQTVHQAGIVKSPPRREETALVVAPQGYELALQPTSISAAAALAKTLHSSRLFKKFDSEDAITAVILAGRELGLTAMVSLRTFHVVEGQPALHAHLIVDRAQRHPDCEYFEFIEGDATFAEYEAKNRRNRKPTRLRYTLEDAQVAGLCPQSPRAQPDWKPRANGGRYDARGNWEKRPAEMLRKTCAVQLVRIVFPGAALGLYAVEELSPDYDEVA